MNTYSKYFFSAIKITERHILLYNSIGVLEEETQAYTNVWLILIGSAGYLVMCTVLQTIFFIVIDGKPL